MAANTEDSTRRPGLHWFFDILVPGVLLVAMADIP